MVLNTAIVLDILKNKIYQCIWEILPKINILHTICKAIIKCYSADTEELSDKAKNTQFPIYGCVTFLV